MMAEVGPTWALREGSGETEVRPRHRGIDVDTLLLRSVRYSILVPNK